VLSTPPPAAGEPPPGGGGGGQEASGPVESGATRWVRQLGGMGDEHVIAAAVRSDGVTVVLTHIGSTYQIEPWRMDLATGLVWLRPDGTVLASRTFPGATWDFRASIALAPGGDITLFVMPEIEETLTYPDFGGGRISGATLVRLSATGTFLWQRLVDNLHPASRVTVDGSGDAVVATLNLYGEDDRAYFLHRFRADGSRAWTQRSAGDRGEPAISFAPDGSLYVAERPGILKKLDASGAVLWTRTLASGDDGDMIPTDVGVSRLGTVALAGSYRREVSFAGTTLRALGYRRAFVAAVESNGAPRFLRDAGDLSDDVASTIDAVVHPEGRVSVLRGEGKCAFSVGFWGLDGALRWEKRYAVGCYDQAELEQFGSWDLAPAPNGDVLVAGRLANSPDLGLGVLRTRGQTDGFVQAIAP
jgi:hypothetical protein